MSKEYSYNGKKYIWITDDLDRSTGCRVCSFLNDVGGCDSMEACATVPYSYFIKVNTETKERIKEAMDTVYEYGGKYYKLLTVNVDEGTCRKCVLKDNEACREASEDCGAYGYFVLHDKTKESKGKMILPTDSTERKGIPITTGVLDYFPLAITEVAKASYAGNKQHHPDSPLFWDKTKSTDHADCLARHLIDRGKYDNDGIRHSAKLAWRALALLEIELEQENK